MVEPIDAFEKDLREQLQARMPPAGFADRVLARASERSEWRRTWLPVWRWAMAALLLGAVVVGGVEHDRRQREGERARAEALLALRITGSTLHHVQQKVAASSGGETDAHTQP